MHFAIVTHGLPQANSLGGSMTCWSLMAQMLADGHQVTVVTLAYEDDDFTASADRRQTVLDAGAELRVLDVTYAELQPDMSAQGVERVFPTARLQPQMASLLRELRPDAAFVYHWDTLAATHGIGDIPRVAGVDDPWHLPNYRRWQQARPQPTLDYARWTWRTLRGRRPTIRAMVELLNDSDSACAFQSQTAADLRGAGARTCDYQRAPLLDPVAGAPRTANAASGRPRLLFGPSQLGATTTSAGLRFFATDVLPHLERALGIDSFDVRVVGRGAPPAELARLLPRPDIQVVGWVDLLADEFAAADIQLVVTPFVLGKRMRIIEGFAWSRCVVAHTAEAVNLPELVDGKNVLLGGSGETIAAALVGAVRDPQLRRRLGENARRTYEENFRPEVAARELIDRLAAAAR
ncbi:MAG: glycosyltransferase family 4 protein [Gaiellaceae bacterium]